MSDEKKNWSEEQIIKAFGLFRNPDVAEKELDDKLRDLLKNLGKEAFGSDDVISVAEKFVPPRCADKLASVIIDHLEQNVAI